MEPGLHDSVFSPPSSSAIMLSSCGTFSAFISSAFTVTISIPRSWGLKYRVDSGKANGAGGQDRNFATSTPKLRYSSSLTGSCINFGGQHEMRDTIPRSVHTG